MSEDFPAIQNRYKNDQAKGLSALRQKNPAWQLLASRRAPLIVSTLQALFESGDGSIRVDDVVQLLSETFAEHANEHDFAEDADFYREARRELRDWIKRRLVVGARRPADRDR